MLGLFRRPSSDPIIRRCPECRHVATPQAFVSTGGWCVCPNCDITFGVDDLEGPIRPETVKEAVKELGRAGLRCIYVRGPTPDATEEARIFDPDRRGAYVRIVQEPGQYPRADVPPGQHPRWRFVRQVQRIVSQGS